MHVKKKEKIKKIRYTHFSKYFFLSFTFFISKEYEYENREMLIELLLLAVALPILGYLLNKFYFSGGRCTSTNRLDGKVAIITGANTGIGYETALDFARRGAKVIMACRDLKKAEEAANKIKLETGNEKVSVEHLDLVDLESVKKFADSINKSQTRLDLLINNAGTVSYTHLTLPTICSV